MAAFVLIAAAALCTVIVLTPAMRLRHIGRPASVQDHSIRATALRARRIGYARIRPPRHARALLRRIIRIHEPLPALQLVHERCRDLSIALLRLRSDAYALPPLPRCTDGTRMTALCNALLHRTPAPSPDDLLAALHDWHAAASTTAAERQALPVVMQLALQRNLAQLLFDLLTDAGQHRRGRLLARRLMRSKRPLRRLLSRRRPDVTCLCAMIDVLRDAQQHELLAAVETMMQEGGTSFSRVKETQLHRQTALAQQLEQTVSCLILFQHVDWAAFSEKEDPLHGLFLHDPSGCYGRMTAASRAAYRQYAARLAARFRADEMRVGYACIDAAHMAQDDAPRDHIGYYLLTAQGQTQLRQMLQSRSGYLRTFIGGRVPQAASVMTALLSACLGWLALDLTQRLFPAILFGVMIAPPVRTLCARWLQRCFPRPQPVIDIPEIHDRIRTLIVLPATLRDASDAIAAMRRLLIARDACPPGAVDVMLLADYRENLTVRSADDSAIAAAARTAAEAIDQPDARALYIQRRRNWDEVKRTYCGDQGAQGLLSMLNELLVHGECSDMLDDATIEPAQLHRRYAYVLVLTEDAQLLPDTLPALIGVMEHPLFLRRETAQGVEGSSMLTLRCTTLCMRQTRRTHGRAPFLYQPGAFAEDCAGLPFTAPLSHAAQASAHACESQLTAAVLHDTDAISMTGRWQAVYDLWRSLPWLQPHGRAALLASLTPVPALVLVLLGGVTRQPLPILAGMAALAASCLSMGARMLREAILLPLHAVLHGSAAALALYDLLRDRPFALRRAADMLNERRAMLLICWSQSVCAIALAGCSLLAMPPEWGTLAAGLLFACFPLPYWLAERPRRMREKPDEASLQRIRDIARTTWRYFDSLTTADSPLPPDAMQEFPPQGRIDETSPEAIAAVLLAVTGACDQGLIAPEAAARRIDTLANAAAKLERWHGLFYARYSTTMLQPVAPLRIDSAPNGLLCCALLLAAQSLRSRLSVLPEQFHTLPAQLDSLADAMRLRDLYDDATGLFFERISMPDRTGAGRHACLASPALPLSFIAVMRREVPAAHLLRLSRARIRLGLRRAMLGQTGSVADYALPPLLLPCPPDQPWASVVSAALFQHVRHPVSGLIGLSGALSSSLDASLRSRAMSSGLALLAARTPDSSTLISPHAAALMLPWYPRQAISALSALESMSMLGEMGFYDGCDPTAASASASQPVRAYSTLHQALLLCACGDALGFSPAKHFALLPGAAAWSSLLQLRPASAPVLSPLTVRRQAVSRSIPPVSREAARLRLPPDAHVIGSTGASALITADGCTVMQGDSLCWTRFTGSAGMPEGLRLYASNGKRSLRIGSGGHAEFHEGHAMFHESLGKLRISLHVAVDPIAGVVWHMLNIANSSASIRSVTIGDLLLPLLQPDGDAPLPAIITEHPENAVLTASLPDSSGMLCHTVSCTARLTALHAATDVSSLDAQLAGVLHAPDDASPCLSFLCQADIPGRGHIELAFATAHVHGSVPDAIRQCPAAESILSISHMYSRIQQEQLGLSPDQALHCLRMTPFLLWRGLPCQGTAGSLSVPQQELCRLGVNVQLPLLLLSAASDDFYPLLEECCAAAALLSGRGFPVTLCILCRGTGSTDLLSAVHRTLESFTRAAHGKFSCTVLDAAALGDGVRSTLEAAASLLLTDARDLLPQLRMMTHALHSRSLPAPAQLPAQPDTPLLFGERYGGFHPHTQAYVHLANPEDASPAAWTRVVSDRRFGTRVSAAGPLASFAGPMLGVCLTHHDALPAEAFFLDEGGSRISPCLFPYGKGCVIRVHHQPGSAVWYAEGNELDIKLTLAPLPGYSAGVRLLRIKNCSDRTREMTLHASACFAPGGRQAAPYTWVTAFTGLAVATAPDCSLSAYLSAVDGIGDVTRMSTSAFHSMLGLYGASGMPDSEAGGSVALLSRRLTLEPGASVHISFMLGAARTMDELERAVEHVQTCGASAVIRVARQKWAQRIHLLTLSTPGDALNLLMNQLLPCFLYTVHPEQTVFSRLLSSAPSVFTGGRSMRARLLNACTRLTHSDSERLMLPLLVAWYIDRSGDSAILDTLLPETDDTQPQRDTLSVRCGQILTGVTLDPTGLPLTGGHASRLNGLRYIASLRAYEAYIPEDSRADAQRMIELVTEAVLHAPVEDHPCLHACWEVFAGLSRRLPTPCDPADFREAVALLQALCLTGEYEHAWQMTEWLNPILHHSAHIPPWQPEADGADMYAAWLYITILESLLGLHRHADELRLLPHLPEDWDGYSLQLTVGSATWHIDCTRGEDIARCDGAPLENGILRLTDDGRIHQAKFPGM